MHKTLGNDIKWGKGGYLGELAAVLWVEAILTMARLGFGQESLNNLKLIVAIIAH